MAFPTVLDPSSTHVCGRAKARMPDSLVELTWRLPLIGFSVFCVVGTGKRFLKHLIPIVFSHKEADFLYPLPFLMLTYEIKTL